MEGIKHWQVKVNGINMHVAEKGEGPVVLLLHGFPEFWYSWRHQLVFLASHGYRALAPDLRGFGDTDAPPNPDSYTIFHIVGDLVQLIDSLEQEKVFLVGHDWGAVMAWYLCLFRPDKITAVVNLSVVFQQRHLSMKPIESSRALYGEDYYICRFQEPGVAEAEIARYGSDTLFRKYLSSLHSDPLVLPKGQVFLGSPDEEIKLPPWLTEEDIKLYSTKYDQTGFSGGLNYYRALDLNWELTSAWDGSKVKVPAKFIVGSLDLTYSPPFIKAYIHEGGFKQEVPNLQEIVVIEGAGHFINQEKSDEISAHIYEFLKKF